MKKCVIFLFAIFSFLNAWYDYIDYKIDYIDIYDSLKQFPPRMRGFGDEEYFEMFIKPQVRDSLNVRCVGRWPFGPGFEVYGDTVNNILCFGSGSGVLVFDISTPSNPNRLSQIAVNGLIMQIYIRDTLLFVSSYGNGVEIFNIADAVNPVKISQIDVPARDFCLKDTFAYCVAEDSLRIINIADILNPFQVGACEDSGYVVSVSGNYAFTGGRWKLSAIDVSDPTNPQVVNSLGVWVYTLTCDGNHCYCVLNTNGFTIYNISDPMNIWQESQMSTVGGVDIFKLGFYVYLPGFVIVDVGDSANPFVVGDTSLPVYAQAVWVNNNFGYGFVANDYEGLTVININNPTNPVVDSQYYGADDSRDVFVQGNYAYVSNLRKGLKVIDITDPSIPYEVGEYDTTGILPNLETSWVRDTLAYVPTTIPTAPGALKILNVQNPSNPTFISLCPLGIGCADDIFLKDSFAYMIDLRVFQAAKINNPLAPESLPRYWLPDFTSANGLFIQDSFAYIADGDSGLRILNVVNPAAPFEVGHFDNPSGGYATGIFVKDTLAYFASGSTGLRILNIKNPSSPFEISFHPNAAIDVIVKDTMAYVTSYSGRVNFISIANPVNPILRGYYDAASYAYKLFLDSNLVFVTCYEEGISILEWYDTGITENDKMRLTTNSFIFDLIPSITKNFLTIFLCGKMQINNLAIYDASGRRVFDILNKQRIIGEFTRKINLGSFPVGVYFVVLNYKDYELVKKVVIIR